MDAQSESLLAGVNPELQRRFRIAVEGAAARGVGVQIHSGYRSYAQQVALWNNRGSNPNPVAKPGSSPHEYGWAVDATPMPRTQEAWGILWDEARKAGLVLGEDFHARKDPPHFELPGFQHGSADPLPDGLAPFDGSDWLDAFTNQTVAGLSLQTWLFILVGVVIVKRFL